MTTKTIGGTSPDYSTINSWEADAPAGTLSAPWEGLCRNVEFNGGDGSGAAVSISGNTTSATNCKILRTDTDASFRDNANKLTNALKYNASNGAAIHSTNNVMIAIDENYVRVENLQLKSDSGGNFLVYQGDSVSAAMYFNNCILESASQSVCVIRPTAYFVISNCLIVNTNNSTPKVAVSYNYPATGSYGFYNCTIVCPSDIVGTSNVQSGGQSGRGVFRNCAVFGWAAWGTGGDASDTDYTATDLSSVPAGSNNQTSKTYSSQFEGVTTSGQDYRVKA